MKRYKNISGKAGILAYETGKDYIKIKFADGSVYLYSYKKPGKAKVEVMKKLAAGGQGFTTYVNQHVRENYESKLSS